MFLAVDSDTIVALATPRGRSGVAIVRLSGKAAYTLALKLTNRKNFNPRYAHYVKFLDQEGVTIDHGLAVYFKAPFSFTGEDVVELHPHGNPVIIDLLLHTLCNWGARMAEPGEFTQRAFLNQKIDLAQAEAISDLIHANHKDAVQGAYLSLQGVFSEHIKQLDQRIMEIRKFVEAAIDFSDEDIPFWSSVALTQNVTKVQTELVCLLEKAKQGAILQDQQSFVIIGKPNVGKSSLFNLLAQQDNAIVSDIPGTTRDVLKQTCVLFGEQCELVDTAGFRETDNVIEKEGIRRAQQAIKSADVVLYMMEPGALLTPTEGAEFCSEYPDKKVVFIINKIENTDHLAGPVLEHYLGVVFNISVKTGAGVEALVQYLISKTAAGEEGVFSARRRHIEALIQTKAHIENAVQAIQLQQGLDLIAEDLRLSQVSLGQIIGQHTTDTLLGEIFSSFCVGK